MNIRDEFGRPWHVAGGDPASLVVNLLRRHGFDTVVLPAETLRTGDIVAADRVVPPTGVVDRCRLYDCMEVLV